MTPPTAGPTGPAGPAQQPGVLDHAVVVATRNRLDMLRASLPLFLDQTRPAARVVVVDRSDDHEAVRAFCADLAARAPMPLVVVEGRQANLPAQRNQGLEHVREAVTIFPDDDVLWYPDTAERLMAVYEADTAGVVGGVSGSDVYAPPGRPASSSPQRASRLTDHPWVMRVRNRVEAALVPQPFSVFGLERIAELGTSAAATRLGFPLIDTIGGYRMSFRTEVVRRLRFDETLGSRIGYAVHEDKDMGLRVLADGRLLAAAPDARVFHNVHPGKRAGGFSYGFFHVLNYAYVSRKVFADGSPALRGTRRYLSYKVGLYATRRADAYLRDVHRGARAALSEYDALLATHPRDLPSRYAEICGRHL